MKHEQFIITRIFNAPRERVWKAWTDPEQMKRWWGPKEFSCPTAEIDLRVGGEYRACMHGEVGSYKGRNLWSGGVYKQIVPYEKIVCTDCFLDEHGNKTSPQAHGLSPDFPAEQTVTFLFEEVGEQTKLSIIYDLPPSAAARDAMVKSGMEEGWNSSLDKFAEVVE